MDKPILFSGPMVLAILEGRKTQTRRALKPPACIAKSDDPEHWYVSNTKAGGIDFVHWPDDEAVIVRGQFPYVVGDRLYVREAWGIDAEPVCCGCQETIWGDDGCGNPVAAGEQCCGRPEPSPTIAYRAEFAPDKKPWDGKWRPSIHMPRSASRLTLIVTDVRVQRLQEISEEDARAEGISDGGCLSCGNSEPCGCSNPQPDARDAFAHLWHSLAKPGSTWADNPWIVAITFDTHHCNINALASRNAAENAKGRLESRPSGARFSGPLPEGHEAYARSEGDGPAVGARFSCSMPVPEANVRNVGDGYAESSVPHAQADDNARSAAE